MSSYSVKFNNLADEHRSILNGLLIEIEIRLIDEEIFRIKSDARKAISSRQALRKNMLERLGRLAP